MVLRRQPADVHRADGVYRRCAAQDRVLVDRVAELAQNPRVRRLLEDIARRRRERVVAPLDGLKRTRTDRLGPWLPLMVVAVVMLVLAMVVVVGVPVVV